jgi:hypothetical protein
MRSVRLYDIFPRHRIDDTVFELKLLIRKYVFIFFLTTFLWNISHSTKNWVRYEPKCTYIGLHAKYRLLLSDCNETNSLDRFLRTILPVRAQLFPEDGWTDGRTDGRKERQRKSQTEIDSQTEIQRDRCDKTNIPGFFILQFCNFANEPKNVWNSLTFCSATPYESTHRLWDWTLVNTNDNDSVVLRGGFCFPEPSQDIFHEL